MIGELTFLRSELVGVVGVSLGHRDHVRLRAGLAAALGCATRRPGPTICRSEGAGPLGFIFANTIIYWSGFDTTLKLLVAIFVGRCCSRSRWL